MPFKTFLNWVFDGNKNSSIPTPKKSDDGRVLVPDILAYNSPITQTYVISIFQRNGKLNEYLDQHLNNMGLWYIEKEELFKFIKKCVIDFRVQRKDLIYLSYKAKNKLYEILRDRISFLKNDDLELMCSLIDKSDQKDSIYQTLGLEQPKRQKLVEKKEKKDKKISFEEFLKEHFSTVDVK
jgi:hypothetical protein